MRSLDALLTDACEWAVARPWAMTSIILTCILIPALSEVPS